MAPRSRLKSFVAGAQALVTGVWTRWGGTGVGSRIRLLMSGSRLDYEREAGRLWLNSVVAIGIKWIGDNFPKPRVQVSRIRRDGKYEPQGRHPLTDLLNRPNRHYTFRTLAKATGLSLATDGNAYWLKVRSRSKAVVELWWVPHWACAPCWPGDGSTYISHYEIRIDAETYRVAPSEIVHFRDGIDPDNDRLGLAALKAQVREVCTLNEESGHTASLLRNSAVPGLMVVPQDDHLRPTPKDAEQIKERVRDGFTGESRGDTIVLGGKYKVVPVGFSPEQLRLDKLPARAEARVLAALGLSPMVVGLPDPNKTYSNLQEAETDAWRSCLVPLQDLVAEAVRWQLLVDFADPLTYTVEFDYAHVEALQENLKSKHDRVREDWTAGLVSHAEACELLGYEIDAEGDRYFPGTEAEPLALDGPTETPSADVQATALNGAQIASLLSIVEQLVSHTLPADSARAMIAASFPMLAPELVDAIVGPAEDFEPEMPEPTPPADGPPALPAPEAEEVAA